MSEEKVMGFAAKVELGVIDADGELSDRRVVEVGVIGAKIPKEVRAYLKSLAPPKEG